MQTDPKPKRKRTGLKILAALFLLLLFLAGLGAGFLLLGGEDLLPLKGEAPVPYTTQDPVQAVRFDPFPAADDGAPVTEASLRERYRAAAENAAASGMNTLLATGKKGIHVLWRDSVFPVFEQAAQQDSLLRRDNLDPLAILCEEAAAQNLQVWLEMDPYAAEGATPETKGRAAHHAQKQEAEDRFSAGDTRYTQLLTRSLSRLPHRYPVAGLVFTGLDVPANPGAQDQDAWRTAFQGMAAAVRGEWRAKGYPTALALSFSAAGDSLVTPDYAAQLASEGLVDTLLPAIPAGQADLSRLLALWGSRGAGLVVSPPAEDSAGLLLFTAAQTPGYAGVVLGSLPLAEADAVRLGILRSTLLPAEGALPEGFAIPQTLAVHYPASGQKIYTEGLFILGTSDPAQPLTLNGQEVAERGEGGAFGVAVTLAVGENHFTLAQGGTVQELTVQRPESAGGGGGGQPGSDGTREAEPGQAVQVATQIAGALTDYGNDGKINETFPRGAVAVVQESFPTTRWDSSRGANVSTWAYRLTSGDYVLARNCTWVAGDGKAVFSGPSVQPDEAARGEWLTLFTDATPAAYVAYEDGVLRLTFYDTTDSSGLTGPAAPDAALWGTLLQGGSVEALDNSLVLSLPTAPNFWGYSLEYAEGQTRLFLKAAPTLSGDPARPLAGVRVLLDPGHGDTDIGAPGLMGETGPNEKDLNLALAQATAYRLRQLGAEVSLTREGDSFPTLEDRLGMQTAQKPDFFLSLHHNSAELTQDLNHVKGAQAYYYHPYTRPASKAFAQNLLDRVAACTRREGGEARWGYFYVTRTTVCPSVLFEYGFIINPMEFEDISSTDGLYAAACATAEGLLDTLSVGAAQPPEPPANNGGE